MVPSWPEEFSVGSLRPVREGVTIMLSEFTDVFEGKSGRTDLLMYMGQ